MEHINAILLSLFIVFVASQIGGEVAQRLRLPSVVGQIAAGCAIGPTALGWLQPNESLDVLAEIGAILLLFGVGLESRLAELRKVGGVAMRVALLGVAIPFVAGGAWALADGFQPTKSAFVAAAFVATSAGITARVLQELGVLSRVESRIILAAAVIDDILAMLVLGVVSALQTTAGVDILHLGMVLLQAVGFVALVAILGSKVMKHSSGLMELPADADSPLNISLAICLGLAAAAAFSGLAAIVGAFLAGMILSETTHRSELESGLKPIQALLLPFFFVVTGAQVAVPLLTRPSVLLALAVVSLLAIASKIIGCGLGALSEGRRAAAIVGVGMVPRGEVGIIVASFGKAAGAFSDEVYTILIAMSLVTSIIAPPILGLLLRRPLPRQPAAES